MDRLLERQIKKHFGDLTSVPEGLRPFIEAVEETYHQSNEDRKMLERSLELSSEELIEINKNLEHLVQMRIESEKTLAQKNKNLEILNTVTQAVHKSLELEEVYNIALDMASELENVDMTFIYLVDRDRKEAVLQAHRNLPEDYTSRALRIPYPKGATWQVINTGKILNIENIQNDPNIGPAGRELGHHGALGIPIASEGEAIGALWFFSYEERRFGEEQVVLLTSIGNQIAIAVAKAELYRDLARKSRYEEIVRTVTQDVHSSLDLHEVLENAVQTMREKIEGVDNVAIYMVEGEEAVLKAHKGLTDSFIERAGTIPYPKGFTWKTIIEGKPRYCADTDKDEYIGPTGRKEGIKSYLSMPIIYEVKTIGCININSKQKNALDKEEIKLLDVVSHQISIAIKNAQQAEALRESEERYKTLYDQSPVGVCLIDRDLKITHCNTSMIQIFQSSHEKVIGLDLHTLRDKVFVTIVEDAFKGIVGSLESPYKATTSPAEIWLSVRTVPLYDDENNVHSVMGVVEDITKRKMVESALTESESKHRTIVEQTYDMTIECDALGTILYANPQHKSVLGYDPEELVGTNFLQLVHVDDRSRIMADSQKGLDSTEAIQTEVFRCKHKNGEIRWLVSTGKAFKTAEGQIRGVISSRDITESKRMEEEILKTQKLESLSILAGGIAHDFNNILTIILGNVNIARMRLNPQDKSHERLAEAENAIRSATGLTQQLLTFSKSGAPIKKAMAIDKLLRDSTLFALRGSNVDCVYSIDDDLQLAEIDEGQINQVINNMIINAQHAMPDGGSIEVGAKNIILEGMNVLNLPKGEYVGIFIKDSGVGIPEEHLKKIFDPFFTTKKEGSGLGLASSFSIVKYHNGHISVDSELGKGTTFTIYLPAIKESSRMTEHEEEKVKRGRGNILIMDDDERIREILGEMLTGLGYNPKFTQNSSEAIEWYKDSIELREKIDAVILDLTIPGDIGGKETLKKLLDMNPDIKAIVSSGYSKDGAITDYETYGFKAYLPKPYTMTRLSNVLHDVLNSPKL